MAAVSGKSEMISKATAECSRVDFILKAIPYWYKKITEKEWHHVKLNAILSNTSIWLSLQKSYLSSVEYGSTGCLYQWQNTDQQKV